jgi:hypothetical protein
MVDVATYNVMYSVKKELYSHGDDSTYDRWPAIIDCDRALPPDNEILLPQVIQGFHLGTKNWSTLDDICLHHHGIDY